MKSICQNYLNMYYILYVFHTQFGDTYFKAETFDILFSILT